MPPLHRRGARGEFYLTKASVLPSEALAERVRGFHIPSLLEIYNVSTLKYKTTLGAVSADCGFGPRQSMLAGLEQAILETALHPIRALGIALTGPVTASSNGIQQ